MSAKKATRRVRPALAQEWTDAQHRGFALSLRKQWRGLWENVGEDVRDALVKAKAAEVAMMQNEETAMSCDSLQELVREVGRHAGLDRD